ncbi:hypothetical protein RSOLAG22IIIB_10249 [Rhizoctonia solani]|uniref:Uncharacterized protein n=1 Tax=Rhizoctonia solani TaxID=456999 RepID=A0A0K6G2H8_9AGAM|nr:hypothetical protein RSOLAG22IIIB_10249 [Rhizoctonia solani]
MNPSISQTTDGWYVDAAFGTSAEGSNQVLPSDLQFTQLAPNNALGLEVGYNASFRKRKRMRRDSPEHSQEERSSLTKPNLLRAPVLMAPLPVRGASLNAPLVTQRLTDIQPINNSRDCNKDMCENAAPTGVGDYDMDGEDAILTGDDRVVETLYEETLKGDAVDLRKLFDLVNELLKTQVNLSQSVRKFDARTQELVATNTTHPANGGGSYVSPPEPPEPISWDQTIQYDEPAGRQRRARRRILLMALIRETIFKLLSRRSVHDPLPPPPPPGLRVPTLLEFAIRWHEYYKSIFNQLAANIVVQKISIEQSGMLTPEELNELPSMVSSHIKYLCRCYKDQNRDDAEDFNALRLRRCAIGTRKRQLFATRLQVLDRFPKHLGKHRHLIVHLGVDGTSSDEEDPKGSGTYKIKKKPQLSSKVTLLKRDLDQVYQLYFKGPGAKGSQVHRRIPSDINSTRPFTIQGLPLPCISRAWYQELDPAEREFYQFTPHNYDFSFPMSLLNVQESGWPVGERSRDVSP